MVSAEPVTRIRWHLDVAQCDHANFNVCPTCDFDGYYALTYPDCPWSITLAAIEVLMPDITAATTGGERLKEAAAKCREIAAGVVDDEFGGIQIREFNEALAAALEGVAEAHGDRQYVAGQWICPRCDGLTAFPCDELTRWLPLVEALVGSE